MQDLTKTLFKVLDITDKASNDCCDNPTANNAEKLASATDTAMKYLLQCAEVLCEKYPTEKNRKALTKMKLTYLESCK